LGRGPGRLCLEALEDRTLPSAFYDLTTLASTAGGVFTSFGDLPSINNQGNVAFVGNSASGNGLWIAGRNGQLTNVNPAFTSNGDGRTYGRGVAINDTNMIVARDQLGTEFYVREWNGNVPNQHTDLFQHPATIQGSPDQQFAAAQTFTSVNNNGDAAFVLYDSVGAARAVVRESGSNLGDGTYTNLGEYDATGAVASPRPQLTDDGHVLFVSPTGQLILADAGGGKQIIASKNTGYTSIGSHAAISKDGRVIVFTATHVLGQELFAAYQSGGAWKISPPLAGGSPDIDSFTSFDASSDLAVNSTWTTDRSVTIAFKGTSALGTGLYSLQLSFFGQHAYDSNPVNAVSYYESGVKPVALVGDKLPDGATISDVALGQGVNDYGRGEIAFWAKTGDGNQEIIRADPQQVVWVNFKPSGSPAVNLNLLTKVGATDPGWEGSMADALKAAQVTLDPNAVQDAVVDEVQQIYKAAGAQVTVLGRVGDTPPAYVPENIVVGVEPPNLGHTVVNPVDGFLKDVAGAYQTIYVGEGALGPGNTWLGLASTPPTAAGVVDFYDQVPDDTAVVFVNNILDDGAYGGVPPASLSQAQVVNGIASVVAHESGHNFGLFHLAPRDGNNNVLTHEVMINGTLSGSFDTVPEFSATAYPVYPYNPALNTVTESSAGRLGYTTGAASGDPPNKALLRVLENGSMAANIGFPAANTLAVKDLLVGLESPVLDAIPVFQDLGGGDLAKLLNGANIPADPLDKIIVLGSTDGTHLDIVGVAQGREGAQNSLLTTALGLATDTRLAAPVTGAGAGLHFYHLTSSGAVDLGLAPIQGSAVNHAPVLSPIANQAVTYGSTVTFTASATDPDAGETLTYSLAPGAPTGASINPSTGAFTWAPTAAQVGQVYNINVVVTDNGTPPLSATQPVTINVLNRLQAVAVTELTTPNPGPMQVAVDFNEALQPGPAQTVGNYKIARDGQSSLPIQSAAYSDNGTQHRVVLTVAAGTAVISDVYHVYIDAGNLSATNGDQGAPKADQLWVDVTSENTLKPITVQPDGSFAVSGIPQFQGYGAPQYVVAGNFTGSGHTDLVVATNTKIFENEHNSTVALFDPLLLLKSNGDGTYAAPVPIAFGGLDQVQGIATVDWNHDGNTDLVVSVGQENATGNGSQYFYYVLLNDGLGHFTNAPDTPIPVSTATQLTPFAVYDLNGNGQYEIIHPGALNSNGDRLLEVIGKDPNLGYTPQMELPLGISAHYDPTQGVNLVGPVGMAFADLNGDGKPDIIVRLGGFYAAAPNFSVILSTPTGYATGVETQDTMDLNDNGIPAFDPVAVGIGNFSGSGHNDIASVFGGDVEIFENDGHGNFTEQAPLHLAHNVSAAAFADLNHDGVPDLVMVIATPYNVSPQVPFATQTFLADGHGGFTPTTPAPIPAPFDDQTAPTSVTLADLDGDGNLDVVLGSSQLGEVRMLINDGTGTMRPPTQALPYVGTKNGSTNGNATRVPGFSQPQQTFADFNNDGEMGFVATGPGGLDVYTGQSDGTFKHTASLPNPFSFPIGWVKVGDLNNDGIPDIVFGATTDPYNSDMAVYLGNGDGTFRQAPTFLPQAAGYTIYNVTLADVNHDGNLDAVATLQNGTFAFGVFFGDGKGNLTFNANTLVPIQVSGGQPTVRATLADFNGDGKLDLLVPTQNSSNGTFSLTDYLGTGNGTFTPGPVIYSGAGAPDTQILVGDLNGDGKQDIITYSTSPKPTATVYLGDGHGGFQQASTLDISMGQNPFGNYILPSDVALGDFNGDGKLDLAVAYYDFYAAPSVVRIYAGDGAGHFAAPQSVTVGANPFTLVGIPRAPFLDAGTFAVTDHGPVANDDTATVAPGSSVSIPVLANDSDPDHAPLTITQVGTPGHGVAHLNPADQTIIYTPAPGFTGTDTFTYTIADPAGVEATATVRVAVHSLTPAAVTATSGGGQSATVTAAFSGPLVATVTDSSGDPLSGVTVTFAGPGSGAGVTFPGGTTATTNAQGQASVTVTANTAAGAFTITASVAGVAKPASFALTNTAGAASGAKSADSFANPFPTSGTPDVLTISVQDAYGNAVTGLPNSAFGLSLSGNSQGTFGPVTETATKGMYTATFTATTAGAASTVTTTVSGVTLPAAQVQVLPPGFSYQNGTLTLTGTAGNDAFGLTAGSAYTATLNAAAATLPLAAVKTVVINGNGGSDTATVATAGTNTLTLTPGGGSLIGPGYAVTLGVAGVGHVIGVGHPSERAYLIGSAGNDTFVGAPAYAYLQGSGFFSQANGFGVVLAFGNGGSDTAYLDGDAPAGNVFVSTPTYTYLRGPTSAFFNQANGFQTAVGTAGSASDQAYLYGGPGSVFAATPTYAYLRDGTGAWGQADGFWYVVGTASGANTAAYLSGSQAGGNLFAATSVYSTLYGPAVGRPGAFINYAVGFQTVVGTAGAAGDSAILVGVPGNTFVASAASATLSGPNLTEQAVGFGTVYGYSGGGGQAYLYGTMTAADTFLDQGSYPVLYGDAFVELAGGFDSVWANPKARR
jgi:hypothetical protein